MPIMDDYWMVPDKTREQLAELFAAFIAAHPTVTIENLTQFLEKFDEIVKGYIDADEKASKN